MASVLVVDDHEGTRDTYREFSSWLVTTRPRLRLVALEWISRSCEPSTCTSSTFACRTCRE